MRYTDEQIIGALEQSEGIISGAAAILGCSRSVISTRARHNPDIGLRIVHPRGGKAGRKQYTDAQILAAIRTTSGNVSRAARLLSCSRSTIEARATESEEIREALWEHREALVDEAEDVLREALERKEAWAARLVLATLGKDRGYTEKQTIDVNEHIIVDVPESFKWKHALPQPSTSAENKGNQNEREEG